MKFKDRIRRQRDKLLQTRERASLRDHALGVLVTLGYALAFILVAALLAFLASMLTPEGASATPSGGKTVSVNEDGAEVAGSKELIENAVERDGDIVVYEGEAIGEALERGKMAWVNVHDGDNAIGIWLTGEDARAVRYFGDYKHVGDTVRVVGRFNRADPEQGGDLDIVASSLTVTKRGHVVEHPVARERIVFAGAGLALLVVAALLYMRRTQGKQE